MKHASFFLALLGLASILFCGCDDKESNFTETEQAPFVLTATQGDQTRMVVGDDGNTTYWEDGDHLYLVDVTGEKQTVTLTTTLAEPATRARFVAENSVLSGKYYVLYGTNTAETEYCDVPTLQDLATKTNNNLKAYGFLTVTDGQTTASINLNLTYARLKFNIVNKEKLKDGKFYCGMWSPKVGFSQGKVITENGLVLKEGNAYNRRIDFGVHSSTTENTALVLPNDLRNEKVYFYVYGSDNSGNHVTYEFVKDGVNLQGGKSYNITLNLNYSDQVTTLTQNGTGDYLLNSAAEFRAAAYWHNGSNEYLVNADVNFAGQPYFEINAKGLKGDNHTLKNISIDFPGHTLGVLKQGYIQDLTLENVHINGLDSIGAFVAKANSDMKNCTLQGTNIIKGRGYIGGLAGYLNHSSISNLVSNCIVTGTTTVSGTSQYIGGVIGYSNSYYNWNQNRTTSWEGIYCDAAVKGKGYVGGLFGYDNLTKLENCTFAGDILNEGAYTGGLVGYSNHSGTMNNCSTSGLITANGSCGGLVGKTNGISISSSHSSSEIHVTVNSTDSYSSNYVGGLLGYSDSQTTFEKCYFEGTLLSSMDYTGGLMGRSSNGITMNRCYNKGAITVSGERKYVGGFCGYTAALKINESFCKTDVIADKASYVGGIVGYAYALNSTYLKNSYMIGNVSGSTYTGGVAGYGYTVIKNTYFYGNVSSGYGVVYNAYTVTNNLTSTSVVYNTFSSQQSDNITNCGPENTYLSHLDIINGEEAFSTQYWKGIDAKCPLLQWQAESFSGETETPGYTPVEW